MWPLTAVDGRVEVARILATRPTFIVRSDCEELSFAPMTLPKWAAAIGRDRFGLILQIDADNLPRALDGRNDPLQRGNHLSLALVGDDQNPHCPNILTSRTPQKNRPAKRPGTRRHKAGDT